MKDLRVVLLEEAKEARRFALLQMRGADLLTLMESRSHFFATMELLRDICQKMEIADKTWYDLFDIEHELILKFSTAIERELEKRV